MLEKKVMKKIGQLKRVYREKENAFRAEQEKLKEYVKKYVDGNGIYNDEKRLEELIEILPDSGIRSDLTSHMYGLELREKEQGMPAAKSSSETDVASCQFMEGTSEKNVLREIEHQTRIYQKKEKEFRAEQERLRKYVEDYLDENGIRKDIEKLDEVIDALPGGILLFRLLECRYILQEEMEAQQGVPRKTTEAQEKMDVSQESGGTQITGMGGIK